MTPDEIAADRAVIDAAPDGPWYAANAGVWSEPRTKEDNEWDRKCPPEAMDDDNHPYWTEWEEWERANPPVVARVQIAAGDTPTAEGADVAKFIAAARTGWPRALDALEAAQAEVERLWTHVEAQRDEILRMGRRDTGSDCITVPPCRAVAEANELRERVAVLEGQLAMRGTP